MSEIQVEIKLSKKLQYELNRIKKEVSNVRKINRLLSRQKKALLGGEKRLVKIIENKNAVIEELKLRLNGFLFHNKYFDKHKTKKEILVEIKPKQAEILFMHLDYEVFILNDDNSESLIDPYIKDFSGKFVSEWWENKRFAIEAKTIPEVKS